MMIQRSYLLLLPALASAATVDTFVKRFWVK